MDVYARLGFRLVGMNSQVPFLFAGLRTRLFFWIIFFARPWTRLPVIVIVLYSCTISHLCVWGERERRRSRCTLERNQLFSVSETGPKKRGPCEVAVVTRREKRLAGKLWGGVTQAGKKITLRGDLNCRKQFLWFGYIFGMRPSLRLLAPRQLACETSQSWNVVGKAVHLSQRSAGLIQVIISLRPSSCDVNHGFG